MADSRSSWKLDRQLASDLVAARQLQEEVLHQLERAEWSPRDIHAVRLGLEEAMVNAIVHGNRRDPAKKVSVSCRLDDERLRVEIADEGEGFDPDALPDCTGPEQIECPRGRGVMLMRHFMTSVKYNAKGNAVSIEKRREDPPE